MSDNDSGDGQLGTPPVTPVKKVQKAKGKGKREATPSDYTPSDVAVGSDEDQDEQGQDEDKASKPKKKGAASKGGSKKASPAKKPKTTTAGGSSPGKGTWTSEKKKKLFLAMIAPSSLAVCNEIAPELEKTATQCNDQWRQRLLPALLKKIDEM